MKEFKSWTNLKSLVATKELPLQYQEFDYYYHIWTDEVNVTYYTELWKDTSKVKGIDVTQNDLDITDWEDNYKSEANQNYPASDISVSQAIDVNVTGGNVTATVDKLKLYSDADESGQEDKGPVDIIEHTGGYKELAIHDEETHDKLELVSKDVTSQEIRDAIGQESGTTVLIKLQNLYTKLENLDSKDFSTETTLNSIKTSIESIDSDIDVALSTIASETTISQIKTNLDNIKTKLDTLNATDFATETTLSTINTIISSINTKIDVNLSTRASESTLQEVRDTIGQESSSTVLSRLLDLWNKLVELFNNGVAKVKLWDGSNEITTTQDGDKTRLDVDANIRFEDEALVQIENITRFLWDGLLFEVSGFESKQIGDSIEYLVRVDSNYNMHIFGEIASELGAEVHIYENPTISSVGTPVTAINGNRSSTNTLNSLIYYEPTISDNGTLIRTMLFSGSNQTGVLGETQSLIFKHGTDYYIKVISRGNGNDINTKYFMYERSIS